MVTLNYSNTFRHCDGSIKFWHANSGMIKTSPMSWHCCVIWIILQRYCSHPLPSVPNIHLRKYLLHNTTTQEHQRSLDITISQHQQTKMHPPKLFSLLQLNFSQCLMWSWTMLTGRWLWSMMDCVWWSTPSYHPNPPLLLRFCIFCKCGRIRWAKLSQDSTQWSFCRKTFAVPYT